MADPLAGGSSDDRGETKMEYDEELDFLSPTFNPQRALYSENIPVPFPEIKSFQSVKQYEEAIKSRAKSKPAAEYKDKTKKSVEALVNKSRTTENASHKTTQHSKDVKASSRNSPRSSDKQLVGSTSVEKRVDRQGQFELPGDSSHSRGGNTQGITADRIEEQALDLSVKTRSVLIPTMSSSSGWPSAPSSQRNYENPSIKSSTKSDGKQQSSTADKKPLSIQGKTLNTSWRSTESFQSHETERRSHPATRSDNYSPKPHKHLVAPTLPTKYEQSPDSDRFKNPESHTSYLSKSAKHLREYSSTSEQRSHSSSPFYSQKQHFESPSPRRHEKLSRDTQTSRFKEKSPHTSGRSHEKPYLESPSSSGKLAKSETVSSWRITERPAYSGGGRVDRSTSSSSQSSSGTLAKSETTSSWRNTEKPSYPLGGRIDRRSTFSASSDRQEVVSDSRKERRHSDLKQSHQTQSPRVGQSRQQNAPVLNYEEEIKQQAEIVPAEAKDSSTPRKSKPRNVFSRMECMVGPLRVLTRCVEQHLQVRVLTRGAVAVKSICRGYIVAFDKHFNLALIDVDEIYRRPKSLGKIKSKRSKKLLAAQKTLQKEREEYLVKWNDEQLIKHASSSLQDLSIQAESSEDQIFPSDISKHQQETLTAGIDPSFSQSENTDRLLSKLSEFLPLHSLGQKGKTALLQQPGSVEERVLDPLSLISKAAQAKLHRIQSVYEDHIVPLSPFEREALMLGIPDENVMRRHVNQLLIRGENIVSVSIIEDF